MIPDFPAPQFADTTGANLAYYEMDGDPQRRRPPIILVHGWPELAYAWRNQLHALAAAGFRALAVDLKGFGKSDAPTDTRLYDMAHLTDDLAGLLDVLNMESAIFCGHDWGGAIVWGMGQWRVERVKGLISLCTPLKPRAPAPPISILKHRFTEKHYFVQFQEPEWPEKLFASDIDGFFRMIFSSPAPRERWADLIPRIYDLPERFRKSAPPSNKQLVVSTDVIAHYVAAYGQSGFHGGINIYRNVDRNWALMEGKDETIHAPSLWIGADLDIFLPPEAADGMDALIPDLETHIIAECGHWMTWEKPCELNTILIDWLSRKF